MMFTHNEVIDLMGRKYLIHSIREDHLQYDGGRLQLELREIFGWTEPAFKCESDDFGCGKCKSQCEPCRKAGS